MLALLLSVAAFAQPKPQAQGTVYLSQAYVDTTVMRALFVLNEAVAFYGPGSNRQGQAVNQAKAILDGLRARAKGDPNERYALMRIGEVETQIALELEEMRKIAEDKRILTANQLVIEYNAEIAKRRPDFALLRGIHWRMAEVDARQANNLADSYNKYHRHISREAMVSLEKALVSNDFDLARRELEYCEKNRIYLMISGSQIAAQRERLERIQGSHDELPRVIAQLDEGEKALNGFRLSESRMSLTMASNRLDEIRGRLPERDASALLARAARLLRTLDAREDSLVRVALAILDKRGPDAATQYMQSELRDRVKLSPERMSTVDRAIMNARPDKELAPKSKVKMVEHTPDETSSYDMIAGLQDKARVRAQEKADSLKMLRDKAAKIGINVYTLLENRRQKDAARLFGKERAFLAAMLDDDAFAMVEQSVNYGAKVAGSAEEFKKNRLRALDYTSRIYALIEKNDIREAYQRFQKYKKPLGKFLDREMYVMLELTVTQSYNSLPKKAR